MYYAFGMGEELVGILNCTWDSSIRYHSLHVFSFLYSFYIDIPLKVARGVEGLCALCVNLCNQRTLVPSPHIKLRDTYAAGGYFFV